jgi:hypothetical protein
MWSRGGGKLDFATGGVTRIAIDADGNVTVDGGDLKLKAPAGNQTDAELLFESPNNSSYGSTFVIDSKILSTANQTDNAYGSKLKFYTNDNSNNLTERLTIDSSGNVTTTLSSANTNTAGVALKLDHTTSGSSAVGFGTLIRFDGERTGSTSDGMGTLGFVADSMSASRVDGAFVVNTGQDGSYTERMRISSTGNVQIGTGSLAAVGGGPTLGLVGAAPEITLRDSATGTPYAVMRTNDNGNLILEADSGDNAGSSGIEFKVDGATKATIASSGIGYFDVGGINLGDTNLSNYKEGSWTPSLVRNGGAITAGVALSSAIGNYTRIGNVVHYWFDMTISTLDNSTLNPASGTFGIGGLPFTSAAATAGGYGAPSFRSMTAVASSIRNNNNSSFVQTSSTYIALFWFNGSAVEIGLDDVTTDLTTGRLTGEGFYFTS